MGLISHSAVAGEQPVIRLEGNVLEGVRIDDSRLKITLAEDFFSESIRTHKLASCMPRPLQARSACFCLLVELATRSPFPGSKGTVKCTIVQEIVWDGAPHPTATIHGHVVRVPNFGKIYFGEMFITR